MSTRPDNRNPIDLRPITIETDFTRYAEGSVKISLGHTEVLCNASLEKSVPKWLEGSGRGWVTAEYSLLPRSTHTRVKRERDKVSGRTQEIQRLIGRSLRAMVDLSHLNEKSIVVDCDVLQADGGTRTAAITGGAVALSIALHRLSKAGEVSEAAWTGMVSAISAGIKEGQAFLDLNYEEDSNIGVDMNFVMNQMGHFIEIQGTAERGSLPKEDFLKLVDCALTAKEELEKAQLKALESLGIQPAF